MASKEGHYDTCEVLYRAGGDPLKGNMLGVTPIDFAKKYNFDDVVTLLKTPRNKLNSSISSKSNQLGFGTEDFSVKNSTKQQHNE